MLSLLDCQMYRQCLLVLFYIALESRPDNDFGPRRRRQWQGVERGLYPSVGVVIVHPIDGVAIIGLVTELADIVDPACISGRLNVGLIVTPLGLDPRVVNESRKTADQLVTGAFDHGMVVKALAVPALDDRDAAEPLAVSIGGLAENLPAQHVVEMFEILRSPVGVEMDQR